MSKLLTAIIIITLLIALLGCNEKERKRRN